MTAEFGATTKALVDARADGACEAMVSLECAYGQHQYHHRLPRGMGGTGAAGIASPSNCLAVCAPCHRWVEERRGESLRLGLLVSRYDDPVFVPALRRGGWRLLGATGGLTPLERRGDRWFADAQDSPAWLVPVDATGLVDVTGVLEANRLRKAA